MVGKGLPNTHHLTPNTLSSPFVIRISRTQVLAQASSNNMDDVRKQAEFDRQMGLARANRMRGDYAHAAECVRLALQVKPEDPEALEFAADVLAARGELEKARDLYKNLYGADPSRTSAEAKYARVTLQIAEGVRQQDLLREMAENPGKFQASRPTPSPLYAAMVSTAPGFGQIYNGQFMKGVIICVSVIICWFFFYLACPKVDFYPANQRLTMFFKDMSPMAIIFSLIGTFIHLYAFVDAPVYANKLKEKVTEEE